MKSILLAVVISHMVLVHWKELSGVHLFHSGQRDGFYKDSFRDARELMLPCLSAIVSEMAHQEKGYEELCSHLMSVILLYLKRKTTLVDAPRPNTASAVARRARKTPETGPENKKAKK